MKKVILNLLRDGDILWDTPLWYPPSEYYDHRKRDQRGWGEHPSCSSSSVGYNLGSDSFGHPWCVSYD